MSVREVCADLPFLFESQTSLHSSRYNHPTWQFLSPSPIFPTLPLFPSSNSFLSISLLLSLHTDLTRQQPRHHRRHPPRPPRRRPNAHMPTLLHRTRNSQRPPGQILQAKPRPSRSTQLVQPRTKILRL